MPIVRSGFICELCGPQQMIGDFGSRTHVLCITCGSELPIDDGKKHVALTRPEIYKLCWESRYEDESIDMMLDKLFGEEPP